MEVFTEVMKLDSIGIVNRIGVTRQTKSTFLGSRIQNRLSLTIFCVSLLFTIQMDNNNDIVIKKRYGFLL